jgi:hypothetical protein
MTTNDEIGSAPSAYIQRNTPSTRNRAAWFFLLAIPFFALATNEFNGQSEIQAELSSPWRRR